VAYEAFPQLVASVTPSYVDFSFGLKTTIATAATNNAKPLDVPSAREYV